MSTAHPATVDLSATAAAGDTTATTPGLRRLPLDQRSFRTLIITYAAFVGIGALLGTVITRWSEDTALGRLDRSIAAWLEAHRTPLVDTLSNLGSALSDTLTVVVVLVILGIVYTALWRRWNEITLMATALALEVTSFVSIAFVVGRNRPPVERLDPSPPTSGFPSGHVAAALALYGALVVVLAWHSDNRWAKRLASAAAGLVVFAVALSRMYRGMHFLTDVVAGAILGGACLAVAVAVVRRPPPAISEVLHPGDDEGAST